MSTSKSKLPFGRNPLRLNVGEQTYAAFDFVRSMPSDMRDVDAEDVALWVRNTGILWDRIQHVFNNKLDQMLRHDPKCLAPGYDWGLGFHPFYVVRCCVADMLRSILANWNNSYGIYEVADSLALSAYDEWKLQHSGIKLPDKPNLGA